METIKVRFKECVAGANFCYKPHTPVAPWQYELRKDIAEGYIKQGVAYAVEVDPERAIKKQKLEKAVQAVKKARKPCCGKGKAKRTNAKPSKPKRKPASKPKPSEGTSRDNG